MDLRSSWWLRVGERSKTIHVMSSFTWCNYGSSEFCNLHWRRWNFDRRLKLQITCRLGTRIIKLGTDPTLFPSLAPCFVLDMLPSMASPCDLHDKASAGDARFEWIWAHLPTQWFVSRNRIMKFPTWRNPCLLGVLSFLARACASISVQSFDKSSIFQRFTVCRYIQIIFYTLLS